MMVEENESTMVCHGAPQHMERISLGHHGDELAKQNMQGLKHSE